MAEEQKGFPNVNVQDLMIKKVHKIKLEMTIHEAMGFLLQHKISGAPVVDAMNKVVTVVSQTDLMKLAPKMGLQEQINQCLNDLPKQIICLHKNSTFTELYRAFLTYPVHRIIIIDSEGRVQGLVSRSNVLQLLYGAGAAAPPDTNVPNAPKKKAS